MKNPPKGVRARREADLSQDQSAAVGRGLVRLT